MSRPGGVDVESKDHGCLARLGLGEAAERTGLEKVEERKASKLEGVIDGIPVAVHIHNTGGESSVTTTRFEALLGGWPEEAGLSVWARPSRLRHRRPFRSRFVWFDDPAWDRSFAVKADRPDTVLIQFGTQRRATFREFVDKVKESIDFPINEAYSLTTGQVKTQRSPQHLYRIENGLLFTGFGGVVAFPDLIVSVVEDLVALAGELTR
ncbi:MAG: hypothetical protein ACR2OI_05970 [Acidimicrobiia bacterium]